MNNKSVLEIYDEIAQRYGQFKFRLRNPNITESDRFEIQARASEVVQIMAMLEETQEVNPTK